jgi:membrane peptidoglycan carboxypeptidase
LTVALPGDVDWYNYRRLHGQINDIPPVEHESNYYNMTRPRADQRQIKPFTKLEICPVNTSTEDVGGAGRQNVKLSQVPPSVRDAVLAAEDHILYSNSGVDPKSVAVQC